MYRRVCLYQGSPSRYFTYVSTIKACKLDKFFQDGCDAPESTQLYATGVERYNQSRRDDGNVCAHRAGRVRWARCILVIGTPVEVNLNKTSKQMQNTSTVDVSPIPHRTQNDCTTTPTGRACPRGVFLPTGTHECPYSKNATWYSKNCNSVDAPNKCANQLKNCNSVTVPNKCAPPSIQNRGFHCHYTPPPVKLLPT